MYPCVTLYLLWPTVWNIWVIWKLKFYRTSALKSAGTTDSVIPGAAPVEPGGVDIDGWSGSFDGLHYC